MRTHTPLICVRLSHTGYVHHTGGVHTVPPVSVRFFSNSFDLLSVYLSSVLSRFRSRKKIYPWISFPPQNPFKSFRSQQLGYANALSLPYRSARMQLTSCPWGSRRWGCATYCSGGAYYAACIHDMADAHPLQDTPILTRSVYEPATDQTPRLLRHLKAGYACPLMHTISQALEPYAAKIKEALRGYRYRYGTQGLCVGC